MHRTGARFGATRPLRLCSALIRAVPALALLMVAAPAAAQTRFQELGAEPVMNSPAAFTAFLRTESERLGNLIRERKIASD